MPNKKVNIVFLEYAIDIIFPMQQSPVDYCSNELWQRVVRYNTPDYQRFYVSKKRRVVEEINNDYNFKSLCRRYTEENDYLTYAKEYINFNFWYTEPKTQEVAERQQILNIDFLSETKSILGYTCNKALVQTAFQKITIWFCKDIEVQNITGTIMQIEGVDGIIMEREDVPVAKDVYFFLKHTVVSVKEQIEDESIFDIPPGYQKFDSIDTVRVFAIKSLIDKSGKENNSDIINALPGQWLFKSANDNVEMEINKNNNGHFSIVKKCWCNLHQGKISVTESTGFLSGNYLVVGDESDFYLLDLIHLNDRWLLRENEIFSYKKHDETI
jgi:GLPGLI family protein